MVGSPNLPKERTRVLQSHTRADPPGMVVPERDCGDWGVGGDGREVF